ncbi:response regulator transcription factor [Nakamurella flavida]|uniref:Response regulator transcription factor n=1 Tax=Nakamurella flavida TaxID=363630 RepID=A0A938YER0_9ACTN|nr:response regulator transcription factor [Nakamurella flavida]MBM9476315.1 response regulator transcription factor [Nakamurella flavida]MDP9779585.1 two-component system response regulator DesR [Nakamurella flavida]
MADSTDPRPGTGLDATGDAAPVGRIRVAVAEDESLIRDALAALLDLEDDLAVVGTFSTGTAALEWLTAHPADVAVLDNEMPGMTGLCVAEELARRSPVPRIIIMSGKAGPNELRRGLRIPVLGFCTKGIHGRQLAEVIRTVHRGERWIDPDLAAAAIAGEANPLREREIDILLLVARGLSSAEIGSQLFLSTGTVRNYISAVCTKLQVTNKVAAVRRAVDAGWL